MNEILIKSNAIMYFHACIRSRYLYFATINSVDIRKVDDTCSLLIPKLMQWKVQHCFCSVPLIKSENFIRVRPQKQMWCSTIKSANFIRVWLIKHLKNISTTVFPFVLSISSKKDKHWIFITHSFQWLLMIKWGLI